MPDHPRPDLLAAFGTAVRRMRRERGWSQEEFADLVGVHRTYIGGIERGERNVSLMNIGRVAEALEVSLATLMAAVERENEAESTAITPSPSAP